MLRYVNSSVPFHSSDLNLPPSPPLLALFVFFFVTYFPHTFHQHTYLPHVRLPPPTISGNIPTNDGVERRFRAGCTVLYNVLLHIATMTLPWQEFLNILSTTVEII